MPTPKRPSEDLIQYQLSELKVIVEQGLGRIEKKLEAHENRINSLELWRAAGGRESKDSPGLNVPAKVVLAALGVLGAVVAALEVIVQARR